MEFVRDKFGEYELNGAQKCEVFAISFGGPFFRN